PVLSSIASTNTPLPAIPLDTSTHLLFDLAFTICTTFFLNATATTEIYTLSLHDALPISGRSGPAEGGRLPLHATERQARGFDRGDRKSTRLNSSHGSISYAVFCLKKKNSIKRQTITI